ncbi:hypothetical protein [Chryseobacterium sp. P1-3]|uniref:hypothetical protein n=1 Tax=Chryseobacterium sp. (strain P1-3) TaxID=1517683 RepID=UPI000B0D5AC5|nr:hypothetical protein [Chryseobacterium sp. P1-3]
MENHNVSFTSTDTDHHEVTEEEAIFNNELNEIDEHEHENFTNEIEEEEVFNHQLNEIVENELHENIVNFVEENHEESNQQKKVLSGNYRGRSDIQ